MLQVLLRFVRTAQHRTWTLPAIVISVVFLTSWPLMALAESPSAPMVAPANYWWWFLITASTVGYGDYFPVTALGHVIGVYVIIGGIAALTTLLARIATAIDKARGQRIRGGITVDISGHVVLLGYTPGRTERIVEQLLANDDGRVVVAAWDDVQTHPLPDRFVEFVRGDLRTAALLRRAGAHRARSVLIDVRDDEEAVTIAVTLHHVAPQCHSVVALRDMELATQVRYINQAAQAVQWHSPRIITEELQSPGISRVYAELMTHGGQNTYSLDLPTIPAPIPFGQCQSVFGSRFGATVLAVDDGVRLLVSPPWPTSLSSGTVIYYVCREKINPGDAVAALCKP